MSGKRHLIHPRYAQTFNEPGAFWSECGLDLRSTPSAGWLPANEPIGPEWGKSLALHSGDLCRSCIKTREKRLSHLTERGPEWEVLKEITFAWAIERRARAKAGR